MVEASEFAGVQITGPIYMNRRITFRIWDYLTSRFYWLYLTELIGVDNKIHIPDKSVLQQYTGLKDNADKEIYEGDILEDDEGYKYEVYWLDTNASFEIVCKDEEGMPDEYDIPTFHWRDMSRLKIVGNIFEKD